MSWTRIFLVMAACVALAGCNLSDPWAGASIGIGSDGVTVSPYAGASLGRARVGIGL